MIAFLDNFSSLPATLQPRIFTTKFPLRKGRRDWKQGIFKYSISGRIGMSWIWSLFFLKFLERSPISKHGFRGSQTFVSGAHPARLRNRVGATKSGRHTFIVYFRSPLATIYNINDWCGGGSWKRWFAKKACSARRNPPWRNESIFHADFSPAPATRNCLMKPRGWHCLKGR